MSSNDNFLATVLAFLLTPVFLGLALIVALWPYIVTALLVVFFLRGCGVH